MFMALPNACFCQVSGKPIVDMPAPLLGSGTDERDLESAARGAKRKHDDRVDNPRPTKRRALTIRKVKASESPAGFHAASKCVFDFSAGKVTQTLTRTHDADTVRLLRLWSRGPACSTSDRLGEIQRRKIRRSCH